ncbi:MAG: GNAT family N-acetyltransferase [Lachnospiraceae bacterium]
MELTTIVLDFTFYPGNPQFEKNIQDWIDKLKEDYTIYQMHGFRCRYSPSECIQSFFRKNGISREDALLLSDRREVLLAAQALGIAILACELTAEQGEGFSMVAEQVWENDSDFLLKCYQREHNLPWEILRTGRLILREEWEEDLDRLYAMHAQPHIARFLEPLFPEREKEREYIVNYRRYIYGYYGFGLWHIIDKQTGLSAGRAGLNPKTYEDGVSGVELGYLIAEPFLRKGYCMEICKAILVYAKETLNLQEVYCLIRPDNEISIHIAKRLGFVFEREIEDNGQQMFRYIKPLQ